MGARSRHIECTSGPVTPPWVPYLWIGTIALWIELHCRRNCYNGKRIRGVGSGEFKVSYMSQHRSQTRRRFRRRVAGAHEASNFARKHGISRAQAERIITRARGSHERAEAIFTLIKKQFLAA